ncbi:MAG: TIR domain-containing protein [Dehalococcoidia bacterium]|nr:TIR domain-containing protein [Dehalococcoidia bacterium]
MQDNEFGRDGVLAESVPCAFLSYSWTSKEHKERIKEWADRLCTDGVDVKLDLYDLNLGDDTLAYMERMVTDPLVSHVLVFSDQEYAEKANSRRAGVGVESQIISQEVYKQVDQSKFIPIVCEFDSAGVPALPVFMKSRKYLDFSTDEKANGAWEQLLRLLHGRPEHVKPPIGQRPSYLDTDSGEHVGVIHGRFRSLETAILTKARGVDLRRSEFLGECIKYADELRFVGSPDESTLRDRVLGDFRKLVVVRNVLTNWIMLEMAGGSQGELATKLTRVLEELLELKVRPAGLQQWIGDRLGVHSAFVYETFLYVVAALIRTGGFDVLRSVFQANYLRPETERYEDVSFGGFGLFHARSNALSEALNTPDGRRYLSPEAELFKRQATRQDITFKGIMEAELLTFMAYLLREGGWWYPGTLHYADHGWVSPLFLRATRHADFLNVGSALGVDDANALRQAVTDGWSEAKLSQYGLSAGFMGDLPRMMNIDHLDELP